MRVLNVVNAKAARETIAMQPIVGGVPELELAALDAGNPAHDLQRALATRMLEGHGVMKSMVHSRYDVALFIELAASSISRAAGPVLLIAAVYGLLRVLL